MILTNYSSPVKSVLSQNRYAGLPSSTRMVCSCVRHRTKVRPLGPPTSMGMLRLCGQGSASFPNAGTSGKLGFLFPDQGQPQVRLDHCIDLAQISPIKLIPAHSIRYHRLGPRMVDYLCQGAKLRVSPGGLVHVVPRLWVRCVYTIGSIVPLQLYCQHDL